jgi:hypothetical protein
VSLISFSIYFDIDVITGGRQTFIEQRPHKCCFLYQIRANPGHDIAVEPGDQIEVPQSLF